MDTLIFGYPLWMHLAVLAAFAAIVFIRSVRPGYMRIQMWSPRTMRVSGLWKKIPPVGTTQRGEPLPIRINNHMYDYYPERIYHQTRFFGLISIPTIEYVEGQARPIDHIGDSTAISEGERAEQQILHETFAAFREDIAAKMMLIIIVGAILLGCGGVWYSLGSKIDNTSAQVDRISVQLGIPTPTVEGR